ncbi:MAG: hypothetical protein K6F32_01210 [Bacilli bacterium]|nr:hypothetical protein [Bacilli bacterium]
MQIGIRKHRRLVKKEREPFFNFDKASFKRIGVILRLIAIPVAIIAMILAVALPTVTIDYANYSQSSDFSPARANAFTPELISGWSAIIGGEYFYYYLKSTEGPTVLFTALMKTDWALIIVMIVALITMALTVMITFSKKMEKWSKLVTLLYFVVGLAVLASPVFFMTTNSFGNTAAIASTDAAHYWLYDSLYVHCAYGAIVSFLVFTLSAVLFAVGTNREMAGGDNRNAGD